MKKAKNIMPDDSTEEKDVLPKKESHEIEKRLSAYLKGNKNEFVNLDVTSDGSKNTQKH